MTAMISEVRRITVSLPRDQVRALKSISKMLKVPVSGLVSELIGEAVTSFEELVVHRDIEGAKKRVSELASIAQDAIGRVENDSYQ